MSILDLENPKHTRAAERLATEIPIWLTTVDAEGQPQVSPVWFWWDGEVFHLFSKPEAPKVRNMRGNPRVSLNLQASETADEDVVIFEGVVEIDGSTPTPADAPEYMRKYRGLIDAYGWTPEGMLAEYSVAFRITPTRVRTD